MNEAESEVDGRDATSEKSNKEGTWKIIPGNVKSEEATMDQNKDYGIKDVPQRP